MNTKARVDVSVKKDIPKVSKRVREITGIVKFKNGFNRKKDYADYLVRKYK